jgi:MSHA pilin protein MshD
LVLYNQVTKSSVDPLVRKQALAIASSLLEEIELRAFTYCDPDDANVYTATASPGGGCSTDEVVGFEPGETRYASPTFDNVNDYDGFNMAGANIRSIDGTAINGLAGYAVLVAIVPIAGGELPDVTTLSDALRITVTVTGPAGVSVSLQGYRLRYAPNSP